MIDISGLDKATVIQSLYAASKPQGLGHLHYKPGGLPRDEAESLVGKYIDYLHGRVMKILISVDLNEFDEIFYDRDNGQGAAAKVIAGLRAEQVGNAMQEKKFSDLGENEQRAALATCIHMIETTFEAIGVQIPNLAMFASFDVDENVKHVIYVSHADEDLMIRDISGWIRKRKEQKGSQPKGWDRI